MFEVESSTFVNNTANSYGGTLYVTPGVTSKISDSTFQNMDASSTSERPKLGEQLTDFFVSTQSGKKSGKSVRF